MEEIMGLCVGGGRPKYFKNYRRMTWIKECIILDTQEITAPHTLDNNPDNNPPLSTNYPANN